MVKRQRRMTKKKQPVKKMPKKSAKPTKGKRKSAKRSGSISSKTVRASQAMKVLKKALQNRGE